MIQLWDNILHICLSISILCNCWSIYQLSKARGRDIWGCALLEARLSVLECTVKDLIRLRMDYDTGVQVVAEDTQVGK